MKLYPIMMIVLCGCSAMHAMRTVDRSIQSDQRQEEREKLVSDLSAQLTPVIDRRIEQQVPIAASAWMWSNAERIAALTAGLLAAGGGGWALKQRHAKGKT